MFHRNIGLVLLSLCKGERLPLFPAFALNYTLLFFDLSKKKVCCFFSTYILSRPFIHILFHCAKLLVMLVFFFDHLAAEPFNCSSGSSSGNSS